MGLFFLFCNNGDKNVIIRQFGNLLMECNYQLQIVIIIELSHCRIAGLPNYPINFRPMRTKNDITIGQALEMMVDDLKLRSKLNESRIRDGWAEIMGKPIAKYTSSVSLREGKLYIKIESAALKQELNYSREKIMELFNKELGANVVRDVVIF
jgi:hypothetical protein